MSEKIVVGIMCLVMVMAMAIPAAVASDENWVFSRSQTLAYAFGEGDLEMYTDTLSEVATGESVEEIIANVHGWTSATGVKYLILMCSSMIKKHTLDYEETKAITSWTSSSLPIAFNGEQAVSNLLDTYRDPKIASNLENIVYVGNEKYTFDSKADFPLDGDQKNSPPSVTLDPRSSDLNGLDITFGTCISDNANAQGLDYTGSMTFGTEVSIGEN
jgi:hypothetical protein